MPQHLLTNSLDDIDDAAAKHQPEQAQLDNNIVNSFPFNGQSLL